MAPGCAPTPRLPSGLGTTGSRDQHLAPATRLSSAQLITLHVSLCGGRAHLKEQLCGACEPHQKRAHCAFPRAPPSPAGQAQDRRDRAALWSPVAASVLCGWGFRFLSSQRKSWPFSPFPARRAGGHCFTALTFSLKLQNCFSV